MSYHLFCEDFVGVLCVNKSFAVGFLVSRKYLSLVALVLCFWVLGVCLFLFFNLFLGVCLFLFFNLFLGVIGFCVCVCERESERERARERGRERERSYSMILALLVVTLGV